MELNPASRRATSLSGLRCLLGKALAHETPALVHGGSFVFGLSEPLGWGGWSGHRGEHATNLGVIRCDLGGFPSTHVPCRMWVRRGREPHGQDDKICMRDDSRYL
jgi:hypothetical protein